MKLRVPALLLSALLAAMTVTQAHASYVVNSGTFYDTGKEYASTMPQPHHDDYYCWAIAASNVTQYWQDTYKGTVSHEAPLPDGISEDKGVLPYGTSYLKIYENFLANTPNTVEADTGAYQRQFIQWYFKGNQITIGGTDITTGGGDYYGDAYTDIQNAYSFKENGDGLDWYTFQTTIKQAFETAGTVVGLDVQRHNPGGVQNKQHSMVCWGYETDTGDASGNITSLIMTDSDDRYFGAFRLDVKNVGGKVAVLTDNHIVKENNDNEVYFLGRDYLEAKNYVYALTTIVTPVDQKQDAELAGSLTNETNQVIENTRITSDVEYKDTSLTVGDGKTVVTLTAEKETTLSIDGNTKGNPGLDITSGALVSVDSLEVKNSSNGGVVATGNLHVGGSATSGDTATFTGNTTSDNGGAIRNESFVDISGNDTVVFSGNHADGKGGAIYSRPTDDNIETYDNTTVSIRGNGSVLFTGNTATEGGNDIYVGVGSSLNIADNGSVLFQGTDSSKAAIVNRGEVYLEGRDYPFKENPGNNITFENCSIDSMGGTVYIGRDINKVGGYPDYDGCGLAAVIFTDNGTQNLNIYSDASSGCFATFDNVKIESSGVYGDSENIAKSLVSCMCTDGESKDYTLQNLTLDTTSHLGEYGATNTITLNNVNITLREGDFDQDNTFDISSLFQTKTNFNGAITFDASSLGLKPDELPKEMMVQLKSDVIKALEQEGKLIKFITGGYEYEFLEVRGNSTMVFGNAQPVVPEPTTGTLSLLALAGLCARRRRK